MKNSALSRYAYAYRRGMRVLLGVGHRFGHNVVRRRLGDAIEPSRGQLAQLDRNRRVSGNSPDRLGEPEFGEDRRMDSASELPKLIDCERHLRLRFFKR